MIAIAADADDEARERAWAAACAAALPRALRDALEAARRVDPGIDAGSIWLAARDCREDEGDADAIAAAGRRARSSARNERREGGKRGPRFFSEVHVEVDLEGEGYDLSQELAAQDIFGANPLDLLVAQETLHQVTGGGLPLPMPAASSHALAKRFGTTRRRQQQRQKEGRELEAAGQLDLPLLPLGAGAGGEK